jgi:hypothetical protein
MHAGHTGAVRRSATLSALGVAAVCFAGSSAYAQPLYEQQPAAGDQQQGPAYQPSPDQQQAPGYPPPAAQYAPPAPYQPPADYQPPPTSGATTQQPAEFGTPPPVLPDRQRGFLILPFLGVNSFQGQSGDGLTVGARFGGMAGLRFGDINGGHGSSYFFSTNGEFTGDWGNAKNVPSGDSFLRIDGIFAASPLLHIVLPSNIEVILGPKFGYWFAAASYKSTTPSTFGAQTATISHTDLGYVLGVNLGGFYGVGESMAVGALLNFDFRLVTSCTNDTTGVSSTYTTGLCSPGPSMKVLGISAAAIF